MKFYVSEKNVTKVTPTGIAIITIPTGTNKGNTIAYKKDRLEPTQNGYILECKDNFLFNVLNDKQTIVRVDATSIKEAFNAENERFLNLQNLSWNIEKETNEYVIASSDEDDILVTTKNCFTKTGKNSSDNTNVSYNEYKLNDKAQENLEFNLCEFEEEANFILDNYYLADKDNSNYEIYREYLVNLKRNYNDNDWWEVAKTQDSFEDIYNYEKARHKIESYVNEKKYEKTTPYGLRHRNQFIVWKWEIVGDRATKVPYNPRIPTQKAKSNDFRTWGSFEQALETINRTNDFAGLGVMFGRGLMGIDFDHCIHDGVLDKDKADIIKDIGGYTEYSPSGDGIHILVFDNIDETKYRNNNKIAGIEAYDNGRFFTLTGNVYENYRSIKKKEETTAGVHRFFNNYLKRESTKENIINTANLTRNVRAVSDDKIIEVIENSIYGNNFKRMFYSNDLPVDKNGQILSSCIRLKQGVHGVPEDIISKSRSNEEIMQYCEQDQSGCDWVMAGILAKFCSSTAQMDRIFRSSAMMREKWDKPINSEITYGENVCSIRFSQIDTSKDWYYNPDFYKKKYNKFFTAERKTGQVKMRNIKENCSENEL